MNYVDIIMKTVRRFKGLKASKAARKAFTLIEILLVTSLISVISVAIVHTLVNGLKIWQRAGGLDQQEDIAIFFDRLGQELRNSVSFSQMHFDGTKDRIDFGTIVRTPADVKVSHGNNEYVNQIGRVEYYFDGTKKDIYRSQANYSQALNNAFGRKRLLLHRIQSLKFQYVYKSGKDYVLQDKAKNIIPSGVIVDVAFNVGKEKRTMRRLIHIPVGS